MGAQVYNGLWPWQGKGQIGWEREGWSTVRPAHDTHQTAHRSTATAPPIYIREKQGREVSNVTTYQSFHCLFVAYNIQKGG